MQPAPGLAIMAPTGQTCAWARDCLLEPRLQALVGALRGVCKSAPNRMTLPHRGRAVCCAARHATKHAIAVSEVACHLLGRTG